MLVDERGHSTRFAVDPSHEYCDIGMFELADIQQIAALWWVQRQGELLTQPKQFLDVGLPCRFDRDAVHFTIVRC